MDNQHPALDQALMRAAVSFKPTCLAAAQPTTGAQAAFGHLVPGAQTGSTYLVPFPREAHHCLINAGLWAAHLHKQNACQAEMW